MNRPKKRIPKHDGLGAHSTGQVKDREPVNTDERRMRDYPRELRVDRPKPDPSILRRIMRAARVLKHKVAVLTARKGVAR